MLLPLLLLLLLLPAELNQEKVFVAAAARAIAADAHTVAAIVTAGCRDSVV